MSEPSPQHLDGAALERLYTRLEKPLYNTVYRWVWHREDAHDVVQETFVRLWRMRARVDMERVDALVYQIALNLASNRRRWGKLRRWLGMESLDAHTAPDLDAETRLLDAEQAMRVRTAVDGLPEKYRRIVMLCEFSDLSHRQIGEIVGIPEGTVGSRRNTALKKLRVRLKEASDE